MIGAEKLFWNMVGQVATVVQNSDHLNHALERNVVNNKVPGFVYNVAPRSHMVLAKPKMVEANSIAHFGLRAGPRAQRVFSNVAKGLNDECLIPDRGSPAKLAFRPFQRFEKISVGRAG